MDRKDIKKVLFLLGRDIRYMGMRLVKDCDKCINNFTISNDVLICCKRLVNILKEYSIYTKQYGMEIQENIKRLDKQDDFIDILDTLKSITSGSVSKTSNTTEKQNVETDNSTCNSDVSQLNQTSDDEFDQETVVNLPIATLNQSQSSDFDKETLVNFPSTVEGLADKNDQVELNNTTISHSLNNTNKRNSGEIDVSELDSQKSFMIDIKETDTEEIDESGLNSQKSFVFDIKETDTGANNAEDADLSPSSNDNDALELENSDDDIGGKVKSNLESLSKENKCDPEVDISESCNMETGDKVAEESVDSVQNKNESSRLSNPLISGCQSVNISSIPTISINDNEKETNIDQTLSAESTTGDCAHSFKATEEGEAQGKDVDVRQHLTVSKKEEKGHSYIQQNVEIHNLLNSLLDEASSTESKSANSNSNQSIPDLNPQELPKIVSSEVSLPTLEKITEKNTSTLENDNFFENLGLLRADALKNGSEQKSKGGNVDTKGADGENVQNWSSEGVTDSENLSEGDTLSENSVTKSKNEIGCNFNLDDKERDTLLELLTEHQRQRNSTEADINKECKLDSTRTHTEEEDKSDENSGSELYDVVREEIVSNQSQNATEKKAWEAFKSLLEDEDESSDSHVDELDDEELNDVDLPDLLENVQPKNKQIDQYAAVKLQFGITKELVVRLKSVNFDSSNSSSSEDDLGGRNRSDSLGNSSVASGDLSVEKLCDLSTVLLGKRSMDSGRRFFKTKRPRRHSALSDSSVPSSSMDEEEMFVDAERSDENSPPPTIGGERESDDNQDALANALWDDIKNSSDDARDNSDNSDDDPSDSDGPTSTRSGQQGKLSRSARAALDSSDEDYFIGVPRQTGSWRRDPLLHGSLSSDSELGSDVDERDRRRIRREKVKKRLKMTSSNSSDMDSDDSSTTTSFRSVDDLDKDENESSQKCNDEDKNNDDSPSKKGKGRRNIRALMKDDDLALSTQHAREEEKARVKRLQEKQKARLSSSFSQSGAGQLSEDGSDPLILDENEEFQVKVHPKITQRLKPHQRNGIHFMWDSCYETIDQIQKRSKGSGCILAHCMGLGKTRQALALVHSLFTNKITNTRHILIVCPLSTVNSWRSENKLIQQDLTKLDVVPIHTMQGIKDAANRFKILRKWRKHGGMLVLGYEAFGLMTNHSKLDKWEEQGLCQKENVLKALVSPGPDLIICDEGHLLRNKQTQRNVSLNQVRTRRRIVLTGTPLQNNLLEYYCMVHFVKPNLLGTEREYKTNFVNPISNGQYEDSTSVDILLMKQRTHVLHKLLDNKVVQRLEDTELKQYLPKLVDQALFVSLSDVQVRLYNAYLDKEEAKRVERTAEGNIKRKNFLADVGILDYLCTHPYTLTLATNSHKMKIKEQDVVADNGPEQMVTTGDWWEGLMPDDVENTPELGTKIMIVLDVLEQAKLEGDKVLIFSQTHAELDTLEHFVRRRLQYKKEHDYLRMDGTSLPEARTKMCSRFNDPDNESLRLFIMSTKVGGLGLTLTAANRVMIMTVNWNPSYDVQSVFRVFRFGQTKPVYVYRLIARDTMEERRYKRQITKLAVAHRVVDKHQIRRHYNLNDFQEMYSVRPRIGDVRPLPNVPEDKVLGKLVQKCPFLYKWHEHQKLLANRPEEDLDEHQKNAAWEEFNRKDVPPLPPQMPHIFAQPGTAGQSGVPLAVVPQPYTQPNDRRWTTKWMQDSNQGRGGTKSAWPLPMVGPVTQQVDKMAKRQETVVKASLELDETLDRTTMCHFDHDYTVPKITAQSQASAGHSLISPVQTQHSRISKKFTTSHLQRQHNPSASESGHTVRSEGSLQQRMRVYMEHLHRLQDNTNPVKPNNSRYQPNPYAMAKRTTPNFDKAADVRKVDSIMPHNNRTSVDKVNSGGKINQHLPLSTRTTVSLTKLPGSNSVSKSPHLQGARKVILNKVHALLNRESHIGTGHHNRSSNSSHRPPSAVANKENRSKLIEMTAVDLTKPKPDSQIIKNLNRTGVTMTTVQDISGVISLD